MKISSRNEFLKLLISIVKNNKIVTVSGDNIVIGGNANHGDLLFNFLKYFLSDKIKARCAGYFKSKKRRIYSDYL